MTSLSQPLLPAAPGGERVRGLDACVEVHPLADTGLVKAFSWRCLQDGEPLRKERHLPGLRLTVVHRGAFRIHSGSRSRVVDATVMELNPGRPYRTTHPWGCDDRGTSFLLDPESVREACHAAPKAMRAALLDTGATVPVSAAGRLGTRRMAVAGDEPVEAEELALSLLSEALEGLGGPSDRRREVTRRTHRRCVDRARAYLVAHSSRPVRLEEVARAAWASPFHLSRIFRRHTGRTIHRTLTLLRLEDALERLASGEGPMERVAREVGFASHAHFTSTFRRHYRMPPSSALEHLGLR